jgi:hypothetical protein
MAEHGTKASYDRQRCRCDACRVANAAYQAEYRARRGGDRAPRLQRGAPARHCDVCVCDVPRFDGPCRCDQKRHVAGECRNCHRSADPVFAVLREAWRTHLQGAA